MSIYVTECSLERGVFASRPFRRGEAILGFGGIVIDAAKVSAKGDREGYPLQIARDAWIDCTEPGALTNHSCDPNAYVAEGNLLVAMRDIHVNEQIMFDYSTTMYDDSWTMICRCGSPMCRKVIREFASLPEELKDHYLRAGHVAPFIIRELERQRKAMRSLQAVGARP